MLIPVFFGQCWPIFVYHYLTGDAAAFTNRVVVDGVYLLYGIETPSKRVFPYILFTIQECHKYFQSCFGCII